MGIMGRGLTGNAGNDAVRTGRLGRKGIAALEFGLLAPVLLIAITAVLDYGIALYYKMQLSTAVRAGIQIAATDPTNANLTAIITEAATGATGLSGISVPAPTTFCECSTSPNVTVSCASSCAGGTLQTFLALTVNYTYTPLFLPAAAIANPITASATVRTQ